MKLIIQIPCLNEEETLPITLRDLMNHRGGFEEGLKDVLRTDTRDLPSTESYLKEHPRPMLFPRGLVTPQATVSFSLTSRPAAWTPFMIALHIRE